MFKLLQPRFLRHLGRGSPGQLDRSRVDSYLLLEVKGLALTSPRLQESGSLLPWLGCLFPGDIANYYYYFFFKELLF